jgi:hypothetical protein
VLLQPLPASVRGIVALNRVYVAAADRSADLLGKVVQRFPLDRVSGQCSIVVPLRLLVSLELLSRHVLENNAGVFFSLVMVLLRLDGCRLLKLLEGRLIEVGVN